MSVADEVPQLDLEAMTGFGGDVTSGLKVHPDRQHLIYPVGCFVIVETISEKKEAKKKQDFLKGHRCPITCLTISKDGRFIASGEMTHMGFKADIIIWDFEKRSLYARLTLHMVKVQALAFSASSKYLVSLGGEDDGSVVVWNVPKKEAICGSPAQVKSAGITYALASANNDENTFVTGGDGTLRVWTLDLENRKIKPEEVHVGNLKRIVKCIEIAEDDSFFYCGTTTGDIMTINMLSHIFQAAGPEKNGKFSQGITALCLLSTGEFLIGAGDGTVAVVKYTDNTFKRTKKVVRVKGGVSSIALRGKGHQFFTGTEACNMYRFNYSEFTHELIFTGHSSTINDVCFPHGWSEVYITCAYENVSVWHLDSNVELLRISVPNMACNALEVMKDGSAIVSGWNDGKIRVFGPESGKALFAIEDSHHQGVTALAIYSDCRHIVSGGREGIIRVWQIEKKMVPATGKMVWTSHLVHQLKEHQATVTCIKIRKNDQECISSSDDGTCIMWDLRKACRLNMIRVNTLFKSVSYHPAEHQIVLTGTDRKLSYWETYDASLIRELTACETGSCNSLDISIDGNYVVSGGDDKIIKLWDYEDGEVKKVGIGHSEPITRCKISPNGKFIISVSRDGAILKWKFPYNMMN